MSQRNSDARKAQDLIQRGQAPAGLTFSGKLQFDKTLKALPAGLAVNCLDISACHELTALPPDLKVRRLILGGHPDPGPLLRGLPCNELDLRNSQLRELPADLRVEHRLDMEGCRQLQSLPAGLRVGVLILRDCVSLSCLPEGLETSFLDISGCASMMGWPERTSVRVGRFAARGLPQLRELPPWLRHIAQLDVRDCPGLCELPEDLSVLGWIDLAGSGLRSVPPRLEGVALRWRGIFVDRRIAFEPESITAQEVLSESNVERRRVLLERMGYERFIAEAGANVLDRDRDPGGERRLFRVQMAGDEPLVCVSVICPSTGRQYIIRVPPATTTCRQAAAWVAGFDNVDEYQPVAET